MKIIGYSINHKEIETSEGEKTATRPLDFLIRPRIDTIRVVSSVVISIKTLIDWLNLPHVKREELLDTTKLVFESYTIRCIPNKFFSLKKNSAFAFYSDLSQYQDQENPVPLSSPLMIREFGVEVYKVLSDLGLKVTSLNNPVKSYEESILKNLLIQGELTTGLKQRILTRLYNELTTKIGVT